MGCALLEDEAGQVKILMMPPSVGRHSIVVVSRPVRVAVRIELTSRIGT